MYFGESLRSDAVLSAESACFSFQLLCSEMRSETREGKRDSQKLKGGESLKKSFREIRESVAVECPEKEKRRGRGEVREGEGKGRRRGVKGKQLENKREQLKEEVKDNQQCYSSTGSLLPSISASKRRD